MKKLILLFGFLTITVLGFAEKTNDYKIVQTINDNVKMYRQAGTASELVRSLNRTDQILFIRRHNINWSIVVLGGEVGYVLHSELFNPPTQIIAMQRRRK